MSVGAGRWKTSVAVMTRTIGSREPAALPADDVVVEDRFGQPGKDDEQPQMRLHRRVDARSDESSGVTRPMSDPPPRGVGCFLQAIQAGLSRS